MSLASELGRVGNFVNRLQYDTSRISVHVGSFLASLESNSISPFATGAMQGR